jgi:hypothetical protein
VSCASPGLLSTQRSRDRWSPALRREGSEQGERAYERLSLERDTAAHDVGVLTRGDSRTALKPEILRAERMTASRLAGRD